MNLNPRPVLPALDVNQRYTILEAAAYLRISRTSVFADIREGRLMPIREGARTLIPGTEIARRSRIPSPADQAA
jgi:excisionase family DNA binding protein